ncbi:hypothetical protein C1646_764643 [Rhizophagus diaphanus]|nr:hypothetical protein C1646_764643 [Rhizophagus diaphanus] [Rhizophagus sp. MUCL 43196]
MPDIYLISHRYVQRNGNYPLISSYKGELNEDNYIVESNDEQQMYETDLTYLQGILNKTKELLNESRNKPKWHLWLKNIRSNFNSLEKMNNDIITLENHRTMPRTWKDFNKNTRYWE